MVVFSRHDVYPTIGDPALLATLQPIMDERLVFDIIAAILLAATAALGAYAPVWISGGSGAKAGQRSMAYSVGNMFSAGGTHALHCDDCQPPHTSTVMVSAGFCHLLADAERRLHSEGHFPLAPFLCALGFLLTLFADNVAHHLSAKHGVPAEHNCHGDRHASIPLAEIAVVSGPSESASKPSSGIMTSNGVSPKAAKVEDAAPFGVVDEALTSTAATAGISEVKPRLPPTRFSKASDGYMSVQLEGASCAC